MGPVANSCGLLLGLAFALWTFFRLPRVESSKLVNLLGSAGILGLIFSVVSPDDDLIQKELICPAGQSVRVLPCSRTVPRRQLAAFSIDTLAVAAHPVLVPRAGCSFVTHQCLDLGTHFATSILIHSPPGLLVFESQFKSHLC